MTDNITGLYLCYLSLLARSYGLAECCLSRLLSGGRQYGAIPFIRHAKHGWSDTNCTLLTVPFLRPMMNEHWRSFGRGNTAGL